MNDADQVIAWMEEITHRPIGGLFDRTEEAKNLARKNLSLLQRYIPKEATIRIGRDGYVIWECPRCKNLIDMFSRGEQINYCCYCGQKVYF